MCENEVFGKQLPFPQGTQFGNQLCPLSGVVEPNWSFLVDSVIYAFVQ